jgi:uncharacterized protein
MSATRPLPRLPEYDSGAFWAATQDHQLIYQRCTDCGRIIFYPRQHCPFCGSFDAGTEVSAGRGSIYTYSVVRRSAHPYFKNYLPYVVAWVELDEGFRMLTQIVNVDAATLTIGDRVRVTWEDQQELSVPLFEPDAD